MFLLRGGCVVSMDPAIGTIPDGDVLVQDGRLTQVAACSPTTLSTTTSCRS